MAMRNVGLPVLVGLFTLLLLRMLRAETVCIEKIPYQKVESNIVFILNRESSFGTGVVIGKGLVLTAGHLYHKKGVYIAGGSLSDKVVKNPKKYEKKDDLKPARVVHREKDPVDLMLLYDERFEGIVEFADPVLDEPVLLVGYTLGERHVHRGNVSRLGHYYGFLDINATFGASGSPIWNSQGQVIGSFNFLKPDKFQLKTQCGFITAKVIREFLARAEVQLD